MPTRRTFISTASLAAGALVAPVRLLAESHGAGGHGADVFNTPIGEVTVHPVSHASFVLQTPAFNIHVDPVGGADLYDFIEAPDLVLITHAHGDHFDMGTLEPLMQSGPALITNPAVSALLPDGMDHVAMANGDSHTWNGVRIDAVPAYNTTEGRLDFHPQGRDNGYVIDLGGFRIYVSGDTEDTPEMRGLENIDIAFVCMNLPFTMDVAAAQDAVRAFGPRFVYPYHYRGRDNGTQDPREFSEMLSDAPEIEVRFGDWYG